MVLYIKSMLPFKPFKSIFALYYYSRNKIDINNPILY